ncbi:class I SAM-dependent methyltransferase [Nodosilinea sp. E11]|uniref:class I SAM-dependent methyltransferase n=1 Tax=Nodosilinea sp. E11 TaxID=3037479 RepID=UPI0029343EC5|nr:methyltransferase domain-containing protein [Nodosilinea sp. E11]WOD38149.1 methyltransferase domain-containing protein [Nodosilinea sp. E11]
MIENNRTLYDSDRIVGYYKQLNRLQPAEAAILGQLKDRLPTMRMLDIGIGGGRTTQHFLPLVGEYTGIDYAPGMIAACQQRFAHAPQRAQLAVVDARDMGQFANDSFDFILFSFNGIDYVSHGDRLRILQELHRVGKAGSYVLFSSHNLQSMARAFDYRQHLGRNPLKTYENLAMWGITRFFNRSLSLRAVQSAGYLVLRDESHNFRLQTYYIRPETQVEQLAFGFDTIEIYPWTQRTKVKDLSDGWLESDLWLYYFCRIS